MNTLKNRTQGKDNRIDSNQNQAQFSLRTEIDLTRCLHFIKATKAIHHERMQYVRAWRLNSRESPAALQQHTSRVMVGESGAVDNRDKGHRVGRGPCQEVRWWYCLGPTAWLLKPDIIRKELFSDSWQLLQELVSVANISVNSRPHSESMYFYI